MLSPLKILAVGAIWILK